MAIVPSPERKRLFENAVLLQEFDLVRGKFVAYLEI
jgi:hypothetical protein